MYIVIIMYILYYMYVDKEINTYKKFVYKFFRDLWYHLE